MRFHYRLRILCVPITIAGFLAVCPAQAATQTKTATSNALAGAVILRPEPFDVTMKSLKVLRQLPLASLSKPNIMIGSTKLDFKPMLNNPRAPFNIAASLRKMPGSAVVIADETTALEIDRGMVVHSTLIYRLKTGTCGDSARRAKVASAGVECATKLNDASFVAAFTNKNDPHYIANPARRASVLAAAQQTRAASGAQVAADIATLRASFKDPAQRGQIDAQVGAAESARLASLSDDQLTMEIVNSAETKIEQTFYIPKNDSPNARLSTSKFSPINGNAGTAEPLQLITTAGLGKKNPIPAAPPVEDTERLLDTHIFLTGFTLGRHYEWSQRVGTTISWCLLGCKKSYYGEVYATFGLGFGLRFPMQIHGLYKHHRENGQETASVTANFEPFDGSPDDYEATGLPPEQIFNGKEIVAEALAVAGVRFKVPFYSAIDIPVVQYGDDYTKGLDAPFANGNFSPPAPGPEGKLNFPALTKVFNKPDQDLLGGAGNYGIFGAQLFGAVKAELHSDRLSFKMHDLLSDKTTVLESTGQTLPLAINPGDHSSQFTLSDPEYTLGFKVTPGLVGNLFIHLAVWGNDWPTTVWFPQVALDLPPGGFKFECHKHTSCSRNYNFSPTSQSDTVGPANPDDALILQWKVKFVNKWNPQCLDQECKDHISGFLFSIVDFTSIHERELLKQRKFLEQKVYASNLFGSDAKIEAKEKLAFHDLKIQQGWQDAENAAAEQVELSKIRKAKQAAKMASLPTITSPKMTQGKLGIPDSVPPPATTAPAPAVMIQRRIPNLVVPQSARTPAPAPESAPPVIIQRRIPDLVPPPVERAPAPTPAPPPVTQGRTGFPNFTFPTIAAPRPAPVVQKSTLCRFTSGPRAGQDQDYAPMAPIPVGSNCQDGRGSAGTVVAR
jgi:hypothetical protein